MFILKHLSSSSLSVESFPLILPPSSPFLYVFELSNYIFPVLLWELYSLEFYFACICINFMIHCIYYRHIHSLTARETLHHGIVSQYFTFCYIFCAITLHLAQYVMA